MSTDSYTINASGKKMGRIASEAAKALMGKMRADYVPNNPPAVSVTIEKVGELDLSGKKKEQRTYKRYSGYPGGLRVEPLGKLMERRGIEIALRKTIERMLPNNTLRKGRMKRLTVKK